MKSLDLSIILKLVDKVTAPLKGVAGSFSKVKGSADQAIASISRFERVSTAVQRTTDRLRGMVAMAGKASAALATVGGIGGGAIATNAISVTADFESMDTVLDTLYHGDQAQIGKAKGFMRDFMVESPFETAQITESFNRLKAYGIDPMDGSLKTMGDTAAAMGEDIMSAVEMMADAIMGENERLKKFGIKGSAIQGTDYIQYEYTDKNGIQQKLQVLKNDRQQIQRVLTQILNDNYGGAQAKLAKTWKGLTSNTKDALNNLQMQFMNAGIFDFLKEGLQNKLDMLTALSKSGKVEQWGKQAADALRLANDYAGKLSDTVLDAARQVAAFAGGWENVGKIGAGAGGLWLFCDLIFAITAGVGALPLLLAGVTASLVDWDKLLPKIKQMFSKLLPEGGLDFDFKGGLKLPSGGLLNIRDAALAAVQARLASLRVQLAPLVELLGIATDKVVGFGKRALDALAGIEFDKALPVLSFGFSLTPFHLLTRAGKASWGVLSEVFAGIRGQLPTLRQQFGDVFGVIGRWLTDNAGTVRATLSGILLVVLEKLTQGLGYLSAKARDGSLRAWLDAAAQKVPAVLDSVLAFGRGVWETMLKIGQFTAKFAEFIGGWDKLAMIFAGGWVIAALSGFLQGLAALLGIITFLASPLGLLVALIAGLAFYARMVYLEWDTMSTGSKALAVTIFTVTGLIVAAIGAYKAYITYLKIAAWWTAFQLTPLGAWIAGLTWASVASGIATAATSAFGAVMAAITSPITLVIAAIAALAGAAYLLYTHWDTIKPMLLAFWEDVKVAWETFKMWVSGLIDSVTQAFWTGWEKVKTYTVALAISIIGFFAELPTKMLEVGGNIINGLWDGLKGSADAVVDWMASFGSDIIDGAKGILGINSPSRVFAEIGGFTVAGMQQGMETAQPKLFSFLDGFGDKLKGWWEGAVSVFGKTDIADGISKAVDATQAALPNLEKVAAMIPSVGVVSSVGKAVTQVFKNNELGALSSQYESRGDAGAIGRDKTGGWSFGRYQIASKTGTMGEFLSYLSQANPAMAAQLNAAGGNAAALKGSDAFKSAWKNLAKAKEFGDAQHGFIQSTHYNPLVDRIKKNTGMDVNSRSKALQDVVWSTSVQHGGNTNIVDKVVKVLGSSASDEALIKAIYAERATRFGKSTAKVRASVQNRFVGEQRDALAMLAQAPQPSGVTKALAKGGNVDAGKFYRVNELGPELLTMGGMTYLMAHQPGYVTPITNQMPPAIQDLQARVANDPLFAQALNKTAGDSTGAGESSTIVPFACPAPAAAQPITSQQTITITINASSNASPQDIAAEVQRVLRDEARRTDAEQRGRMHD